MHDAGEHALRGGPADRRPWSHASRLAEASKQLEIVLEAVDLEAEPELGEALTDAVTSVERARRRAAEREDRHHREVAARRERDHRRTSSEPSVDARPKTDAARAAGQPRRAEVEPARPQFVWEAPVE